MPAAASSSAAEMPAMPPPTTITERLRNVRRRGRSLMCCSLATAPSTIFLALTCARSGSCACT